MGKSVLFGALTVGVVLTATPANAAVKPQSLPSNCYSGTISTDIGNYLGGTRVDGDPAYTTTPADTTWCVQPASEGGYYLLPYDGNGSVCLDGNRQIVGDVVRVWSCNGTEDQRWCWNGAGYLVRQGFPAIAAKDNGRSTAVTLASGNASKFYFHGGPIANSC